MSTVKYPKMGDISIVPAADLISLTSNANAKSPARVGELGFGKRAGTLVYRDSGTADRYSLVFATGDAPSAPWLAVDGATKYQPV